MPILDWRPNHHPGSRDYPIRELIGAVERQDRQWDPGQMLNQGPNGACVGFSWTSEALAAPIRVDLNRLGIYAPTDPELFAHFLYGMAQYLDIWKGQEYEGTSVLAGAQAAHNAGLLHEYRWAFGLNDVLDTISAYGPVVIGINWYSGMNTAPNGAVRVSGNVVGGHAVVLTGYTRNNPKLGGAETVTIKNSWGTGWGAGGFADLPTTDLARLLSEQGEACVPVSRSYGR